MSWQPEAVELQAYRSVWPGSKPCAHLFSPHRPSARETRWRQCHKQSATHKQVLLRTASAEILQWGATAKKYLLCSHIPPDTACEAAHTLSGSARAQAVQTNKR